MCNALLWLLLFLVQGRPLYLLFWRCREMGPCLMHELLIVHNLWGKSLRNIFAKFKHIRRIGRTSFGFIWIRCDFGTYSMNS